MVRSGISGKRALLVGGSAFFMAVMIGAGSQAILSGIESVIVAFLLLIAIILSGIIFDIIGVAATAAKPAGLHARASRRIKGAKQALNLVKNAHNVSSFCNDVVGDVSATLSGAIGTAIVYRLVGEGGQAGFWASLFLTAVVSALTIGGKACSKGFAITQADDIVFEVGRVIAFFQQISPAIKPGKGKR